MNSIQLAAAFDEAQYLGANRDVAKAVETGSFPSAWHHFIRFGYRENRRGVGKQLVGAVCDISSAGASEPLPPERLRVRVHGAGDASTFDNMGRILSFDVLRALAIERTELPSECRFLDFGCGCGRVFRYLGHVFSDGELVGTDVDGEAILWSRDHLSHIGTFVLNGEFPPLEFPAESFDLVCAISIFTHLPEEMQFAWLAELQRVTRKGGYLLLSVHGPGVFDRIYGKRRVVAEQNLAAVHPRVWKHLRRLGNIALQRVSLTKDARNTRRFRRKGFFYLLGTETAGLPDFYHTSFHTEQYIRERWSAFFDIRRIIRKGIANNQDLVVCRRGDCM